jgi:hypothetical protein
MLAITEWSAKGVWLALLLVSHTVAAVEPPAAAADLGRFKSWIEDMKQQPRGPFKRLRWFCDDGAILPPKAYACREHGGGRQHGEWSDNTVTLRAAGFSIGNVLAAVQPTEVLADRDELLQQILLEQFLIRVDNGWILRRARYYRGAFQAEDEEAAARLILQALLADDVWLDNRLLLIYEAARLLPHGVAAADLTQLRADAAALHREDPGFGSLRNKIHGRPDSDDAQAVRRYASRDGRPDLAARYEVLAAAIEAATDPAQAQNRLAILGQAATHPELRQLLTQATSLLDAEADPTADLHAIAQVMAKLRRLLRQLPSSEERLVAVDAGLILEQRLFVDAQRLRLLATGTARQQLLAWLADLARAWYGVGGLSDFEWQQFQRSMAQLAAGQIELAAYRQTLTALERATSWAQRRLAFHFEVAIADFTALEPLAAEYIPDRLRSSPMLMYSALLEALAADANRLAGVRHSFFGKTVSTGLRSLNPGLASGLLLTEADFEADPRAGLPKILVVPETLAELPPVAGILTEHEGNHLSHVQLLARNLGIPNVVIDRSLQAGLDAQRGRPVELASSPGGIVRLRALSEAEFAAAAVRREPGAGTRIVVDVDKLDLTASQPIPLSRLRGTDSGVTVGPKAAQLSELKSRYPDAVSPGLALPFGIFRQMLDQPFNEQGLSAFVWLTAQYDALEVIEDPAARQRQRNRVLATIRDWILSAPLPAGFADSLRRQMAREFGAEGSYGVFVRSDTNVEDLEGFTGAGLNLTVANVVGFEQTINAIRQVWASPFSERSFGWRQALMREPEHLYAAVLLHKSVNSDISGVMVTADVETGSREAITVVINEGVGGGVEGQSAETVVIDRNTQAVTLRSSATAPRKRVLLANGGSTLVAASGAQRLLTAQDAARLSRLVTDIETWMTVAGAPQVADVEFGFVGKQLVLFQIRPFVENSVAGANQQLLKLDAPLRGLSNRRIDLAQPIAEAP